MNLKNSNTAKVWVAILVSFILLIASAMTFFHGGLSIGKGIIYEANSMLDEMESDISEEEIHEFLSSYNINMGVGEYVDEMRNMIEDLSDANVDVPEAAHLTRFVATTMEGLRYYLGSMGSASSSDLREYDRGVLILRIVSIVLYILYVLSIVSVIVSFIFMLIGKRSGPLFFAIINLIICALYIAAQIRIKNIDQGVMDIVSRLGVTDAYLLNSHISGMSVVSLILTWIAVFVWSYAKKQSYAYGRPFPSVIGTVKSGVSGGFNAIGKRGVSPASVIDRFEIRCSNCNATLKKGQEFCPRCGQKRASASSAGGQVGMHFCVQCGKKVPDGSAFCPYCGEADTE